MYRKLKLIMLLALFCLPDIARGALPTEGDWSTTTVGNQTVNLTGNINLKGTITIPNGKTLTINANGATRYITNKVGDNVLDEGMFYIEKGGKLVINGTEEYSVVIDGGANYQTTINYHNGFLDDPALLVYAEGTHRSMKKPAIRNSGTLIMEYVTVRNVYNSCASDASSAQKAGAVLHAGLSGTVKTTLTNCVVERCKSPLGSGLFMCSESVGTVTLTDCEFRDCVSTETKGSVSTGTIRSFGDTETSLNMYRVKVHHCYANLSGGGVYINAAGSSTTMATISGCEIYNNYSEVNGGGFNGGGNFQFTDTYGQNLIHNNHAGKVGGGIHFYGYSGGKAPSSAVNVKEIVDSSVEVYGNDAPNGAGIAFSSDNEISLPKNSTYSLSIEGADIHDNVATNNGGGVYYDNGYTGSKYSFSAIIKMGSNIHENEAGGDGGGLYMNKAPIIIEGGTIHLNTSKNGAGLYVQNGDVQIGLAEVSSNTAEDDGGGFYVDGGNVTISDGIISGNNSVSGGGIYINDGNFTFTNGNVEGNTATLNGGGAYVSGGDVTFKGNFSGNTAANGGGLYLGPGATMDFQGGLIINNEANMPDGGTSAGTAYHGGTNIMGCGGGIYLQNGTSSKKTTLTFSLDPNDKTFGLYTNRANMAGDDLVAEGQYTEVVLPSVREMQLYGFEGKDATSFWYQDYFEWDTGYQNHADGRAVTNAVNYIGRFREMLNMFTNEYYNHRVADDATNLNNIKNNYLCLTLSYNMLDITISAKYLLGHETAMFRLVRHGSTDDVHYDVLLRGDRTDSATGKSSRTLRNMPWGTYSIYPNDAWNWAYEKIAPQQNLRLGETGNYEFLFDMQHINGAEVPQHDERQPQKASGN